MVVTVENILLIGSVLVLISILVGKTSYKFGVPILLLFLGVGMLAGSEGIGGIQFDDPKIAQFIGIVCLNFILFAGGLETNLKTIKPVFFEGLVLSTLGVLLTAVSLGTFVWLVTDFTIYEGLLLGSIVSSTDAAAVFSLLRSKSLALKSGLRPTLEFESASNDPMAFVLTITFLAMVVDQNKSLGSIIPFFIMQLLIGGVAGLAFGWLNRLIINKIRLVYEGLYPVLVIALMFVTFSATDFLGGNGFLAIYVCAVYMGNKGILQKKTILKMYDAMAWLVQIVLFLTLGLLVFPTRVYSIMGIGLLVSFFLILIARPIGVLISLSMFKMRLRRRIYISWVGLRGAVPIVFATYPLIAGIDKADTIFNIVFFISLTSVLFQGTTFTVVAKWLGVAMPEEDKIVTETDKLLYELPKTAMKEIEIMPNTFAAGKRIVDLGLKDNVLVAMIKRSDKYLTPSGSTRIEAGDNLLILSEDNESLEQAEIIFDKIDFK